MRPLLLASVVIVLAAAVAPGLLTSLVERRGAGGLLPAGDGESAVSAKAARASHRVRQVEIKAAEDGHFYLHAEINFRPVRVMVDTGASVIALRQSDAHAVGIRPHRSEFAEPVQTANGIAYAAAAELDTVAVEDVEVSRVRALILPDDQLAMSLLGGAFLNRLARFEVSDGTLIFEN